MDKDHLPAYTKKVTSYLIANFMPPPRRGIPDDYDINELLCFSLADYREKLLETFSPEDLGGIDTAIVNAMLSMENILTVLQPDDEELYFLTLVACNLAMFPFSYKQLNESSWAVIYAYIYKFSDRECTTIQVFEDFFVPVVGTYSLN